MKKSLFYLAATLLIATTSCSEDNNDDDPKGQESNITLYAPDDWKSLIFCTKIPHEN